MSRMSVGRIRALIEQIVADTVVNANIVPSPSATNVNLGSFSNRWSNVYVGDLHMQNDRGHYQLIEEEEYLSIRNHKNGKLYKFVLEEIEETDSEEDN